MPNYVRAFQPGGTFFLTLVTEQRTPLFAADPARHVLHESIERSRQLHPFNLDAVVLLPDYLHFLITLPDRDANFSVRITSIKSNFTRRHLETGGTEQDRSQSRRRQRARGIWQRRFWERTIRDEADMNKHLDYIHYNPVKHGHVRCPHGWPHSSFHRFVNDNFFAHDWYCQCDGRTYKPVDFSAIAQSAGE